MRRLILGTAGHIDHGKTALVRALTGIDTDRLPEEKRRGITIDLGFANLTLPSGDEIGIVDVPGHEAFVRNMLAGATGIDLALLVIAADESVMPQTREHLAILELLGVRAAVIALTKADLVADDWLDLAAAEVRETLAGGALAQAPILPVSARTGRGIDDLVAALQAAADASATRDAEDLFRLPIDRVFTVRGTGTVVTGTVWSGSLAREQTVRRLPDDRVVRVRGLQAFGHARDRVVAGERAAVALAGLTTDDLRRGDLLVTGAGWMPSSMVTARVRVIAGAGRPLRTRQRVRFHLGTAELLARAVVLDGPAIEPGREGWVQLRLESPVVARAGDRFVLRSYSPVSTIAGGTVADPAATKRQRIEPQDRENLELRLDASPAVAVAACVRAFGARGVAAPRLPVLTPHSTAAVESVLRAGASLIDLHGLIVHALAADQCSAWMSAAIDVHHQADPLSPGITLDALRRAAPPATDPALFDWTLRSLELLERCVVEGVFVRRADFTPSLQPDQHAAIQQITQQFLTAGLTPPALHDLPPDLAARPDLDRLLSYLERSGHLVLLAPSHWIHRAALDDAIRRARAVLRDGRPLTPADFRALYGISRKYLIPLLEHFDRTGVTVRRGVGRELTPALETP